MSQFEIRFEPDEADAIREALSDPRSRFWRGKSPRLKKRLPDTLEKLKASPYQAARSHHLKGQYTGLRAADVEGTWRLLYKVCEECRREGMEGAYPLSCCRGDVAQDHDRIVNIVDFLDYH